MRVTVSSGIFSAAATKPQPETRVPIGGTPTLRRTSMANRRSTSRARRAGLAGRWGGTGFPAGRCRLPRATSACRQASGRGMDSPRLRNFFSMRGSVSK